MGEGRDAAVVLDIPADELRTRVSRLFRYAQAGRCVRSVTHDMNNYLGAILAYAELVALDDTLSPESRRMVAEIGGAVRKCGVLLSSFASLARKETPQWSVVPPMKIVEQALQLRGYSLKASRIAVETVVNDAPAAVVLDQPKMVQSLVHVLMNAEEACMGVRRPVVRVTVRETERDIEIAVWNSGPPVAEEDREVIFEPFFSTKEGEHLGLGLSSAREIAHIHKGNLTYSTGDGFELRFPKKTDLANTHYAQ